MFLRRKNVDIFFEQTGNPEGTDVLIVHGGPGAGINTEDRKVFPSSDWRVTDYDQRGCGKSKPRLDLEHNNTELLIEDIEALRKELGIESWVLSGGSWGTTLSLLYAIRYPERVQGLILRSVFLCRDADISWINSGLKERPEFIQTNGLVCALILASQPETSKSLENTRRTELIGQHSPGLVGNAGFAITSCLGMVLD